MKAEAEEITAKRVTKDVSENTRLLDLKNLMRSMKLTAAAALRIPRRSRQAF